MRRVAALLLVLCLGGCGLLGGREPPPAPDILKPGDPLRIAVVGEEDLTGVFVVDADRTVHLPIVGNVPAGGLTIPVFEDILRKALADGYLKDPQLLVARADTAAPAQVVAPAKPLPILPVLRPSQPGQ